MKPKDVLTLLQIVDLSSKSPAYAGITGAAHAALVAVQLHVIGDKPEEDDDDDEEKSENHPSRPMGPPPPRRV